MPYRPKLFAGIDLDARTRARCAEISARLQSAGLQARFEAAEKLHITLAFLGWVDPERVEPIRQTLREVASRTHPFTIDARQTGCIPART